MTTVTDADREAAADYFELTNDALRADFARCGNYDLSVCVQTFARHREAEVAKIVAFLRKSAAWHDKHDDGLSGFDKIRQGLVEAADAIEAGEYRNDA